MTSSLKILKCPEELTNRHSILVVLVCSLVDHGPKHQFPASRPAHWPIWIQHGHRGEHHYFVHRWIKAIYHPQIDHRSHSPYSIWVIYIYIDHVHHITQLYPIIIIIPCFFTTEKTCFTHWLKDHKGPCYPPNDLPGGRAPCIWKQTQEAGGEGISLTDLPQIHWFCQPSRSHLNKSWTWELRTPKQNMEKSLSRL